MSARFWNKVKKTRTCWLWLGYKDSDGYGTLTHEQKKYRAHRFSWLIHYGEIPEGMSIAHRCDNGACVNPSHLFLATHQQNLQDMCEKGRQARGETCGLSVLNNREVLEIRKLYSLGGMSQSKIAKQFGVATMTINRIVRRQTWRHL